MKIKKILALFLAAVMVFAFIAACADDPAPAPADPAPAPADPAPEPEDPDPEPEDPDPAGNVVLRLGTSGLHGRFTPITASNVYDSDVVSLVFDSLLTNDAEGNFVVPGLATHWEISEDRLVYTLFLDPRATFSDGTPLTASDVVFTANAIAHEDYDGPRRANIANMEMPGGVVALDDHTVEFNFIEPSPVNIQDIAFFRIMPEHIYGFEDWDDFLDLEGFPVGSGRFLFVEWRPMEYLRLEANPNHWDPDRVPNIDEILIIEMTDELKVDALATGTIDFAHLATTVDNYDALVGVAGDGVTMTTFVDLGYQYLQFNTLLPQLEDVRVRQALLYALDRQAYVDIMLGPLGRIATAPLPPPSWAFPPDEGDLNLYELDLDRARELMAEAGFEPGDDGILVNDAGVRMEIHWPVYTEVAWPGIMSELAADTWTQIGVDLTIELTDFPTVIEMTSDTEPAERTFGVYVMGFSLAIDPDPTGGLFCGVNIARGDFNASGFSHARADELVALGRTEFDPAVRAPIYWEWGIIMNYYVPTVIIAYRDVLWAVREEVNNLDMNTFQRWTTYVHNVTID